MIHLIPSIFWWGRQNAVWSESKGWHIRGKRAGLNRGTPKKPRPKENKGGVGKVARRRRGYANPKLARKYGYTR